MHGWVISTVAVDALVVKVDNIKETCDGIQIEHFKVQCLLYAADIAFISGFPEDLQCMLINPLRANFFSVVQKMAHESKSPKIKCCTFSPKHVPLSSAIFRYDDYAITTVSSYKYLGVIFDKFLYYTETAIVLASQPEQL